MALVASLNILGKLTLFFYLLHSRPSSKVYLYKLVGFSFVPTGRDLHLSGSWKQLE